MKRTYTTKQVKSSYASHLSCLYELVQDQVRELSSKIDQLAAQNRILENQIAQQASNSVRPNGALPGKPEPNPREHCKDITLRSGRAIADHDETRNDERGMESEEDKNEEQVAVEEDKQPKNNKENPKTAAPPPYRPPVPFPQRLAKPKADQKFSKFLEILKKLHINIPFTDALTQMPSYAKFLKEILSKKREVETCETVALTEECSALLQNKLPPKLKDPGSFSKICLIGNASFDKALCDLGASVSLMPHSVYEKLGIGEIKPTRMSLQLADRSVRLPLQVGKFFIPVDFVVIEMEEDQQISIILGRPFLATAGAVIDVKNGKLTLQVGEEKKVRSSCPYRKYEMKKKLPSIS